MFLLIWDPAKAAKEIANLVGEIKGEIAAVGTTMREGSKEVGEGLATAETTRRAFQQIIEAIGVTFSKVKEVSSATRVIAARTEEVSSSLSSLVAGATEAAASAEELAAVAEEQNATVEEFTALAQELVKVSDRLQQTVRVFTLTHG